MNSLLFAATCIFIIGSAQGKTLGGLIFTGVDSINTKNQYGYDLNYQMSCTTFVGNNNCFNHFLFYYGASQYFISPSSGYAIKMYKMNLDSIKNAPADSIFFKNTGHFGDTITVDSLASRIGNVYLLRTSPDPRDGYPYYAKIKILNIAVKDSAKHQVIFKFLYAVQNSGTHDIATSNLDTFHLGPTATLNSIPSLSSNTIRQSVFKVFGNNFTMPKELAETNAMLTLYDLKGRKLGLIETQGQKVVDVRSIAKGNGVVVVRINSLK